MLPNISITYILLAFCPLAGSIYNSNYNGLVILYQNLHLVDNSLKCGRLPNSAMSSASLRLRLLIKSNARERSRITAFFCTERPFAQKLLLRWTSTS